jgi:hypothetical protein
MDNDTPLAVVRLSYDKPTPEIQSFFTLLYTFLVVFTILTILKVFQTIGQIARLTSSNYIYEALPYDLHV